MEPNCPNCKGFAEDREMHAGGNWWKVTVFRLNDVVHVVPSMWLAGRIIERGQRAEDAMADWAWHCEIELGRAA